MRFKGWIAPLDFDEIHAEKSAFASQTQQESISNKGWDI